MKKKTKAEMRSAFSLIYKGQKNFMTPHFIKFLYGVNQIVEIASGESFDGSTAYGITSVKFNPETGHFERDMESNFLAYSEEEMNDHLQRIGLIV